MRHGNRFAQRNIAVRYITGRNAPKELATGLAWLNASAAQGDAPACRLLGEYYGHTGDRDKELTWRRKAAEPGDEQSKQWLAERSGPAEPFIGPSEVEFRRNLSKTVPRWDGRTWLNQRTEFYAGGANATPTAAPILPDRKFYYLNDSGDVCVSGLTGENQQKLFHVDDASGCCLVVNGS